MGAPASSLPLEVLVAGGAVGPEQSQKDSIQGEVVVLAGGSLQRLNSFFS